MSDANVSRLCPRCRAENPPVARICRNCGADIDQSLALTPGGGFDLPALSWRQVGTTLAVGLAAAAVQVGRSLLRQWLAAQATTPAAPRPSSGRAVQAVPTPPADLAPTTPPRVTIVRKTWWHTGSSQGQDDWGSRQDVWEIYDEPS